LQSQPWSKVTYALTAGMLAIGGLFFVSSTANAAGCGAPTCTSPLFNSRDNCLSTQSNYSRYYRIVLQCTNPDGRGYFFLYTDR